MSDVISSGERVTYLETLFSYTVDWTGDPHPNNSACGNGLGYALLAREPDNHVRALPHVQRSSESGCWHSSTRSKNAR